MLNENFVPAFLAEFIAATAFGLLAIALLIIGFVAFDKATPGICFKETLHKQPYALALVIVGFMLGVAYVMGHVFHGR